MEKKLVSAIILAFNGEKTISATLDSVLAQDYGNLEIIVVDNASADGTKEILNRFKNYDLRFKIIENSKNIGFAGMNIAISASQGEYVLYLNQDVILDKDFINNAVGLMDQDEKIGVAQGKLIRKELGTRNQELRKKIIDSTGIKIFKSRRMVDRGQGEEDKGQYEKIEEVFGCNGAVSFFRKKCLEDVKITSCHPERIRQLAEKSKDLVAKDSSPTAQNDSRKIGEYYDPDFFLYKEDVDLSWRIRLYGWKIMYCPKAVAYVDRTTKPINEKNGARQMMKIRKKQKSYVQYYSFKNHRLAMIKNELPGLFFRHLPWILPREIGYWLYVVFFEPKTWPAIIELFKQMPSAWKKRKIIMKNKKIGAGEMGKWFK